MITNRRKQAIIEMAKRGTPEEQVIAESIIENLGISIENEEIIQVEFTHKNKYEEKLLHQIAAMIINKKGTPSYSSKTKPKSIWYDVTKAQEIEINLIYSIYKREVKEEFDLTFHAFIQKNSIFPQWDIDNPKETKKEDKEKCRKIFERAGTIKKTHIKKQIESKD